MKKHKLLVIFLLIILPVFRVNAVGEKELQEVFTPKELKDMEYGTYKAKTKADEPIADQVLETIKQEELSTPRGQSNSTYMERAKGSYEYHVDTFPKSDKDIKKIKKKENELQQEALFNNLKANSYEYQSNNPDTLNIEQIRDSWATADEFADDDPILTRSSQIIKEFSLKGENAEFNVDYQDKRENAVLKLECEYFKPQGKIQSCIKDRKLNPPPPVTKTMVASASAMSGTNILFTFDFSNKLIGFENIPNEPHTTFPNKVLSEIPGVGDKGKSIIAHAAFGGEFPDQGKIISIIKKSSPQGVQIVQLPSNDNGYVLKFHYATPPGDRDILHRAELLFDFIVQPPADPMADTWHGCEELELKEQQGVAFLIEEDYVNKFDYIRGRQLSAETKEEHRWTEAEKARQSQKSVDNNFLLHSKEEEKTILRQKNFNLKPLKSLKPDLKRTYNTIKKTYIIGDKETISKYQEWLSSYSGHKCQSKKFKALLKEHNCHSDSTEQLLLLNGNPIHTKTTYSCDSPILSSKKMTFDGRNFVLGDARRSKRGYDPNSFAYSMAMLKVIESIEDDLQGKDAKDPNVPFFRGEIKQCRKTLGNVSNCCDFKNFFINPFSSCNDEERELANLELKEKRCIYIDEYRYKQVPSEKRRTYCCYPTRIARIIQQIAHHQLPEYPIGGPDPRGKKSPPPNCGQLTAELLSRVDFSTPYAQRLMKEFIEEQIANMKPKIERIMNNQILTTASISASQVANTLKPELKNNYSGHLKKYTPQQQLMLLQKIREAQNIEEELNNLQEKLGLPKSCGIPIKGTLDKDLLKWIDQDTSNGEDSMDAHVKKYKEIMEDLKTKIIN